MMPAQEGAQAPSTRRAGGSYSTVVDMEPAETAARGAGSRRRRVLVASGLTCAALLCVGAAGGGTFSPVAAGAGPASLLLGRPSAAEMNSVAWKALHSQFQREDAELQAQLGIAALPSLRHLRSGVSGEEMSSALGDTSAAGLSTRDLSKGAAQLRILKRYGERGESMDNDMGFAGDAGPYSALLQTSAVVGDPTEPGSARVLPMLWESGGGASTEYAEAMSANGLAANDKRWPDSAAKSAAKSLQQEAAKAAQQLISSEHKARAQAEEQRMLQKQRFLSAQAREQNLKLAKAAAEQAIKKNEVMQTEQERQDAESDGHGLAQGGQSEYDADYQTLLATGAGVEAEGSWRDPALPGEDIMPHHQRLAYSDAIQHWADEENRVGISPNEPRSSSTPPGTSTLRVAPLRAALQERMREAAARSGAELGKQERAEVVAKRLSEDYTGNRQQLSMGIGGIGPGEEEGNDKDWRVAMEVDPNCRDTLNDMEAGSLGALMHGSDDCGPNRKKLPVFWPYARTPGENWQPQEPADPAAAASAATALNRQQQLLQSSRPAHVPEAGVARGGGGSGSEAVKVLERDVEEATASEQRAVGQERALRRQDRKARAVALAAVKTQGALEARVHSANARSQAAALQLAKTKTKEAAMAAQQQALVRNLSTALADAAKEVSLTRACCNFSGMPR